MGGPPAGFGITKGLGNGLAGAGRGSFGGPAGLKGLGNGLAGAGSGSFGGPAGLVGEGRGS